MMMPRYRIVPVHGEGGSLFHIVDQTAPEAEQPAIVASYRNRFVAEEELERLSRTRDNPGAKLKVGIDNFHDAVAAIQRFGDGGKIGNNTTVVEVRDDRFTYSGDRGVGIRLHRTVIVAYFPEAIVLNSGGYRTSTTKNRMNEVLPPWLRIRQEKFDWYVDVLTPMGQPLGRRDFEDQMVIYVDPQTYLPNPMKRPTAKQLRTAAGRRDWGGIELQEAQAIWDRAMSRRAPPDPRAEFLAEASRKPLGPITHADYLKAIRHPISEAHLRSQHRYKGNPGTFLNDPDDVRWLKETHLANASGVAHFKSFLMYGNEDYPNSIGLFRSKTPQVDEQAIQVWVPDDVEGWDVPQRYS